MDDKCVLLEEFWAAYKEYVLETEKIKGAPKALLKVAEDFADARSALFRYEEDNV
jgi:hypothetical protein